MDTSRSAEKPTTAATVKGGGGVALLLLALAALWSRLRARTLQTYSDMVQQISDGFAAATPPSTKFDMVIGHDDARVDVGADVPLASLATYLRKAGKTCPVLPRDSHETVGHAFRHLTAGRGSAAAGFFHDTVLEADVLCGNGQVVRCSRTDNPAVFASLAGSGEGALARVLRLRLPVSARPTHVTVHAMRATGFQEAKGIVDDMVREHGASVLDAEIVVSGPEGATVLVAESSSSSSSEPPLTTLPDLLSRAEEAQRSPEGRTVSARVSVTEWWAVRSRDATAVEVAVPQSQLARVHASEAADMPRRYAYVSRPGFQWNFAPNAPSYACWCESGDAEALARLSTGMGGRPMRPLWGGDSEEHFCGFTVAQHVHQIRARRQAHDAVRAQVDPTGRFLTVRQAHGF